MDPSSGFGATGNNKSELKNQELVVGARGFEPRTSCAQGRRTISWKSFLFNLWFENKRVKEIFGSGTLYRNVAPHAWSPLNSHHSDEEAKATGEFKRGVESWSIWIPKHRTTPPY
jgi:hypothetical protein